MPEISVVAPVYNVEDCLEELCQRLKSSIERITPDYELILVEDCGKDRSWEIIRRLAQADRRIKGIHFSRNFGQQHAITAGLDHTDGNWVVVMDSDLQDPPEEIPRLYAKAREGFDIVLALRTRRKDPFFKRYGAKAFYKVFSYLAGVPFTDRIRNYRIMSRRAVLAYRQIREQLRFFTVLVDWIGFPTATIDGEHSERTTGKSSYTVLKLWVLGIDTIIAYSNKPLRLAIGLGLTVAGIATLAGIYLLFKSIFYGFTVLGWPSLIVSLYFFSGLIISILGLNGLYLGKVFNETKGRPLYLIQEKTGS
jgi:polyisoprenyl-phosphate glycosyltransferase